MICLGARSPDFEMNHAEARRRGGEEVVAMWSPQSRLAVDFFPGLPFPNSPRLRASA